MTKLMDLSGTPEGRVFFKHSTDSKYHIKIIKGLRWVLCNVQLDLLGWAMDGAALRVGKGGFGLDGAFRIFLGG